MSINVPNFPTQVWDGTSPTRSTRLQDSPPDQEDWDQLIAEIIATQTEVANMTSIAGQAAIPNATGQYSNTAQVKGTLNVSDTVMNIDTHATENIIPISTQFTVVGSSQTYTVIDQLASAAGVIVLDGPSSGTFTVTIDGVESGNIAYDVDAAGLLTAINAMANIVSGDYTVTGAGTSGDPFVVIATTDGNFPDIAIIMSADFSGLTGGSPSFTQVAAAIGGFSRQITFTPAITTGNVPADNAVITFTNPNYLTVGDAAEDVLQIVPNDALDKMAVIVNRNFTDLNMKLNDVLAKLRLAGVILT